MTSEQSTPAGAPEPAAAEAPADEAPAAAEASDEGDTAEA